MNIAIFTNNYLPNPYGVAGSVESFRKEFEKKGHKVYIFAPDWKDYKDENPNVFRYPAFDLRLKIKFPLAIPYSTKMDKILKELEIDVIHSQHPNLLGLAAERWARIKKVPLIFTWHALYDKYVNFVPIIPKKVSIWYIIMKAVNFSNRADALIVPTDSIIPIVKKWGVSNKSIFPISTGVEEIEFSGADGESIRKKYNISQDEKVLLLVCRLSKEKNVEFIFNSLKDTIKKEGIKFLVVGGGYLEDELKNFCLRENIQDKVIFSGEVKREEAKNYYAAGDIFVYASKSETQGMVISEAMYMGLPVVAVAAPGINSLVLNNGNGILVKENKKDFQEAVEKLLRDKELCQKFGEVSQRIAKSKFTSSVCAEKMLEIYNKFIKSS